MSKPVVNLYMDEYARNTGLIYSCSYGGIVARGETPKSAYDKLIAHFNGIKQLKSSSHRNSRIA